MADVKSLVYVDLSNISSSKGCPINSTKTPCIVCEEKCNLSFTDEYFQSSCSIIEGGLFFSGMNTNSTSSYLTFNENSYTVEAAYLLAPSINTYASAKKTYNFTLQKWETTGGYCDYVIIASSQSGRLIIYVPIVVGSSTTITLPDLDGEITNGTQTLASMNLFSYMASQKPFYYYTAQYNGSNARYIIFPNTSSNASISNADYTNICNKVNNSVCPLQNPNQNPLNNYFTLYENKTIINPIYYNALGANISTTGEYYLDCRMTEEEMADPNETKNVLETQSSPNMKSTTEIIVIIVSILLVLLIGMLIYYNVMLKK